MKIDNSWTKEEKDKAIRIHFLRLARMKAFEKKDYKTIDDVDWELQKIDNL